MGGKSYFCDFCQCYFKNDVNVRKVHNAGLVHKIAKENYMKKYEDPRKILKEEQAKIPCHRYFKGQCKFDLYCQFTHFSQQQLRELKEIVQKLESGESEHIKEFKVQKKQRSKRARLRKLKLKNLPPSLRSSNVESTNSLSCEWG